MPAHARFARVLLLFAALAAIGAEAVEQRASGAEPGRRPAASTAPASPSGARPASGPTTKPTPVPSPAPAPALAPQPPQAPVPAPATARSEDHAPPATSPQEPPRPGSELTGEASPALRPSASSGESIALWVLAGLALALSGTALILSWFGRRDDGAPESDAGPALAAELAELRRSLDNLEEKTERHLNKLDVDIDQLKFMLNQPVPSEARVAKAPVSAAVNRTPLRPQPSAGHVHQEERVLEDSYPDLSDQPAQRVQATAAAGILPQVPRPVSVPPASPMQPKRYYSALQDAAASALADAGYADAGSFTLAVLSRLPAEARNERKTDTLRLSAHLSSSEFGENFTRPDFISVQSANGQVLLLPNPRAGYLYSHGTCYDGDAQAWPRIGKAAKCRIDAEGRAVIIEKGTLE